MRRWIVMLAALLAFRLLPSAGTELSKLRPASLLYVNTQGKQIQLTTDTGDAGSGETLEAALQNMRDSSSGVIYLDTVEHLMVANSAAYLMPQLAELLRPTVRLCRAEGELNPEEAGAFLQAHIPRNQLHEQTDVRKLQYLKYQEGRYTLEEQ